MVTVYTITYNEEKVVEFFINHYRKIFPNCEINIFDNQSTDNTVKICEEYGCNVIEYDTGNKLSDSTYLKIKNNCWKESKTDWVVVCDCDELIEVNQSDLNGDFNIIKPVGYSIMNFDDDIDLTKFKYGFRDVGFDKCVLFNKKHIKEINYSVGSHGCNPIPHADSSVIFNKTPYRLLHYKYLHPNYTVERHKMFGKRLSDENRMRGWGIHYNFSSESIYEYYNNKKKELIKLL